MNMTVAEKSRRPVNGTSLLGLGISLGRHWTGTASEEQPDPAYNCVAADCILEAPYLVDGCHIAALHISANPARPHKNCVFRNCFVDGGDNGTVRELCGFMAAGGVGTILQSNNLLNCRYGFRFKESLATDEACKTVDLVILENYLRKVLWGIYFQLLNSSPPANPVGRVIALQNQFEMERGSETPTPHRTAIRFDSSNDTVANLCYDTLILRGNRVRPLDGDPAADNTRGLYAQSVENLTMDNNFIDASSPDLAAERGSATNVQAFNNRTLGGVLLPVAIKGTNPAQHEGELTTDAELMIATI